MTLTKKDKLIFKNYKPLEVKFLKQVPGCAISADQAYREADLAIDFCEDVLLWKYKISQKLKQIFEENGAIAKISSIHVNVGLEIMTNSQMSKRFAKERLALDLDQHKEKFVFCGDSPNDAPMFEFFPNSCGVANVLDFQDQMQVMPTWITQKKVVKVFLS